MFEIPTGIGVGQRDGKSLESRRTQEDTAFSVPMVTQRGGLAMLD